MKVSAKKMIKGFVGHAAEAAGIFDRDFRSKMVIVTFHRVNDWMAEDAITCSSARFMAFTRFFQEHFRVVRLSEQITACRNQISMGGTLSITFDDGYRDNFDVVAPILRGLGLPATFFVTTGFIGTEYRPPWDQHLSRQPGWMEWEHVRALRDQGFEIGAHTDRHIDLSTTGLDAIRTELADCRGKLQTALGAPPTLFAYPFGGQEHISPESLDLVREAGFECCLGAFGGVNPPVADPYQLNRISVGGWFATPQQLGLEILLRKA